MSLYSVRSCFQSYTDIEVSQLYGLICLLTWMSSYVVSGRGKEHTDISWIG